MINILKSIVRPSFSQQTTWALLRLAIGVFMIHHGFDKLHDIENFAEAYVAYLGLPFPIFLSYLAAYSEIIGSVLLMVGLITRFASLALLGTMSVAIYHHIVVSGGISVSYLELSGIYWVASLFFLVNGPGLFSLDGLLSNQSNKYKEDWKI